MKPIYVLQAIEREIGQRFCVECDKLRPVDAFASRGRDYKYSCKEHVRAKRRKEVFGSLEKHAFNTLRCRARQDMLVFGHKNMVMGITQIMLQLTAEQLADYSKFALIPIVPSLPLTASNVMVITNVNRHFVIESWKTSGRDDAKYKEAVDFIIKSPI
jgi:hypothetical protein